MYLLDTCIISDLSPDKTRPDPKLADWLRRNGENCYLSAVTLTEIAYGVARLRHRGATAKAAPLGAWSEALQLFHADRIISVDADIATRAGVLLAIAQAAGSRPGSEDAWIAATAELNGLELLTFNQADFQAMRVACRNPAADLPPDRNRQRCPGHRRPTLDLDQPTVKPDLLLCMAAAVAGTHVVRVGTDDPPGAGAQT